MKAYDPSVLIALDDALKAAYWYKADLKSMLIRAGVPEEMVQALPWDGHKWEIVKTLVDRLAKDPLTGTPIVDRLVNCLVEMDSNFPHLARLEDGPKKVREARDAITFLKDFLARESLVERAERARRERRTEAERVGLQNRDRQHAVRSVSKTFADLCLMSDVRKRGLEFEKLLRELFKLYDLDPRGSFASPGEQIDGSITFDGRVLLVEARWREKQVDPREVRDFRTKVHDKLDSTIGLMISMSGYTEAAVQTAGGGGRILVVLMDGQDLAPVFQGLQDFTEVVRRKLRHAAEKGESMYRVIG